MKPRALIKIAVFSSILLLCVAFGMYFYFKLSAVQEKEDFDLYTLVPQDAHTVFETNDMASFMDNISKMSSSKKGNYLHVSRLFSIIQSHFHSLLGETSHGFSEQMSKMLISFHAPDGDRDQVLYFCLGPDDDKLIESFIRKYCSDRCPSKYFDYKGEEIRIYSMTDGNFLSCYFTPKFLAVSYQKKLIEEVIDARISGRSLLDDVAFRRVHKNNYVNIYTNIYVRMLHVPMGKPTDATPSFSTLGGWTEFDLKMNGDAVYLSGVSHDADSCLTFMNALRCQTPVEGLSGEMLPASTFLFSRRSVSDLQTMFTYTFLHKYATATYSDYIRLRDDELGRFLKDNVGGSITSCLFHAPDTVANPCAVMNIPVTDSSQAERMLRNLLASVSLESAVPFIPQQTLLRTKKKNYTLFSMPRNTLFARFTGITIPSLLSYACFYHNSLLVGADLRSLSAYIRLLDEKQILDGIPVYEERIANLSTSYNFLLMADLEDVFAQPESYVRLIPAFFFRYQDFFSHFILSIQFTCTDGEVYPNVILLYKNS